MISLIICSRNKDISAELKSNIAETIGQDYELVIIDNSNNEFSIFSAYNEGVRRSKGDILCFMHEDILFHTQDWGQKILQYFLDPNLGMIGVVGGHYLPDCPASWWSTGCRSGQIIQGEKINDIYTTRVDSWHRYKKENISSIEVVAVDGLWFCIPKVLFGKIKFDNELFSGFHCYDADICMQIIQLGLEIRISFDILIEHFSLGNHNSELIADKRKLHHKWEKKLPVIKGVHLSVNEIEERKILVEEMNSVIEAYHNSQNEVKKVRKSKAYRLGKFLLKPLKFINQL